MKHTIYQRRLRFLQDQVVADLERIAYEELQVLWADLVKHLRRLHRTRPALLRKRQRLAKASMLSRDLWQLFRDRLRSRLLVELEKGFITLAALNGQYYGEQLGEKLELDTTRFAAMYERDLDQRVYSTLLTTQRKISSDIVEWYNTPGSTLQSLVDDLAPTFGYNKASQIAVTEVTRLSSRVNQETANRLGIVEWWWQTRRDQTVCTDPIAGPDAQYYDGCRALHGKVFGIQDWMPPDGSHPGCRCNAILIPRKRRGEA